MRMLLHACCGPCSLEPSRILSSQGHDLTIFYANSNIAPAAEYERRLETLRTWAGQAGIAVQEGEYDQDAWGRTAGRIGKAAVSEARNRLMQDASSGETAPRPDDCTDIEAERGFGAFGALTLDEAAAISVDPEKRAARCRACYRLRLEEAARCAATQGFEALSTTLAVSPYQYSDIIREELERAAAQVGVQAAFEDFRPFYPEATRRSRELGMYRQNYCGCLLSDAEASAERAERKAQRKAQQAAERAAHADDRAAEEARLAAKKAERAAYDKKQARKRAILKALREK